VLRALAKAARSDITALIAGDGEHREDLERLSKELGLSKQVHFIGYQQDAPGFLLEVDVLISASRFEGQPNAVLEAIAVGCPLLLSDIPEHQETLSILLGNTNLEPLLFKDDSVEDLAEKLETIHERIQVLREYATLMHSRASVLSLDRMISGWVDVLAGAGISSPPADGK
jgi:glycosyltransferase involved in cell wall biosynthesis